MIFLKYISDAFEELFSKLKKGEVQYKAENGEAEFEEQLKEEAILNALVAENLGKVKQNLSDSEEKESGEKGSQNGWSERVVKNVSKLLRKKEA